MANYREIDDFFESTQITNKEPIFLDIRPAATVWQKYDPLSILAPVLGEWCLWSVIIKGQRNYFAGRLGEGTMGSVLYLDGHYNTVEVTNGLGLYYARIVKLVFEDE